MEIVHLALAADWVAALASGEYRVSTLGASLDEVGFIHASTRPQLTAVAERFYAGVTEPLLLLVMDDDAIRATGTRVQYEVAGEGELFPHVYGPIRPAHVTAVIPAHMDRTGALAY